jgi:hypothetical protein
VIKLARVIDSSALRMMLLVLTGWLERREREAIAYLTEENRLLRRQLGHRRLHLTDGDRRRLAARAYRAGRAALREIATIATPDTLTLHARRLTTSRRPNRMSPISVQAIEQFPGDPNIAKLEALRNTRQRFGKQLHAALNGAVCDAGKARRGPKKQPPRILLPAHRARAQEIAPSVRGVAAGS